MPTNPASAPSTPSKSPRRPPQCAQCRRPRAGHPRSGCPYAGRTTPVPVPAPATPPRRNTNELTIDNSLSRLDIHAVDDQAERRRRRSSAPLATAQTLQSLCTEDSAIINNLLEPGILKDDPEEFRERIGRWQEELPSPRKKVAKPTTPRPRAVNFADTQGSPSPKSKTPTKALGRTKSMVARQAFVDDLADAATCSPAIAYVLSDANDISEWEEKGQKLGFHARKLVPREGSNDVKAGLLVVGQDKEAVDKLFTSASNEAKSSGLRKYIAGVAVGAVVAVTGLAFS